MSFQFPFYEWKAFDGESLELTDEFSVTYQDEPVLQIQRETGIAWGPIRLQDFKMVFRDGEETIFTFHGVEEAGAGRVLIEMQDRTTKLVRVYKDKLKEFALWLWFQNHKTPEIRRLIDQAKNAGIVSESRATFPAPFWPAELERVLASEPEIILKPLQYRFVVQKEGGRENVVAGKIYYAFLREGEIVRAAALIDGTLPLVKADFLIRFLRRAPTDANGNVVYSSIHKIVFINRDPAPAPQAFVAARPAALKRSLSLGGGR